MHTILIPTLAAIGVRFAPPIKTGFIVITRATPRAPTMRMNAQVCSQSLILWWDEGAIWRMWLKFSNVDLNSPLRLLLFDRGRIRESRTGVN